MRQCAESNEDPHLVSWIEDRFIKPMSACIRAHARNVAAFRRCGRGIGEYLVDRDLLIQAKALKSPVVAHSEAAINSVACEIMGGSGTPAAGGVLPSVADLLRKAM